MVCANQQPAPGNNGFNPPSLLSIATGAPYFHNGAAAHLDAIFDERFSAHLTSGNAAFHPTELDRADLAAFLLSIDETTRPFDVIPESVICPLDFSRNTGGDDHAGESNNGEDYGAEPGATTRAATTTERSHPARSDRPPRKAHSGTRAPTREHMEAPVPEPSGKLPQCRP